MAGPYATLQIFYVYADALLAKGVLESAGIECVLADEGLGRLGVHYPPILGGIKLQVRRDDLEAARQVLHGPFLAE
jgi:hypothetical protein